MTKLPLLSARELIGILERLGFRCVRQEGSHAFFRHPDGRVTIVPIHGNAEIRRGLLSAIIKNEIKMERDEFLKLVR
jgi:predicted RNA binding protein YcfA (HicA-like mRNA interferase family)